VYGGSTGETSKTLARKYCDALNRQGRLIPEKLPTLAEWAASRRWWAWGECEYLRGQLARSSTEKPAVSRAYADKCARDLAAWILPHHGGLRIDKITAADCERLLFAWREAGLSAKTINNRASIHRVMMAEAERLGMITRSPWRQVSAFVADKSGKGILTVDEARRLLNPETVETVWAGNHLYYVANLAAAVTALRQGEILALRQEHIYPDHIHVAGSWDIKYGTGPTKTRRVDDIPIPRFLYDQLSRYLAWPGYVLSYTSGRRPATGSKITAALNAALVRIGISEEQRVARNIKFHSWRAFANTYFRSCGIPGEKVRQITRHDTEEMTEHYSRFRVEDFHDIAEAQESMVAGLQAEK
jgi:integrase